ncbi:hypothetical protein [Ornithinibacillus sp. JPR2-1]|uniref:hypothetical protein n=1 Tax=Ornithinibacillus sp. JPR2-1 TaxID=2094019 RepID=UPI0031D95787
MNYYNWFFKLVKDHPELPVNVIYIGICKSIANDQRTTKGDFIDATRAFEDYKEELNNERISRTVSAS